MLIWFVALLGTSYLYGYVDNTGRFVIPPRFNSATDFKEGKAMVSVIRHGGGLLMPCEGSWNYSIDRKGNTIGYPKFVPDDCEKEPDDAYISGPNYIEGSERYPFPSGVQGADGFMLYGFKDKNNQWVTKPRFSYANNFYNNVSWVMDEKTLNWGFINKKGEYVLPPKCTLFGNFHDGLAKCRVKTIFGLFY